MAPSYHFVRPLKRPSRAFFAADLLSISLISAGAPARQGNRAGVDVRYRQRVAKTSKLVGALARRGPHRVLRGDLAFAGLPGVVYTPDSGFNLPGVAFGHDWLTGVARYSGLLEHLASWGIVAAAPDNERGVAPSVLNLAFDLGTALDIAAGLPGRALPCATVNGWPALASLLRPSPGPGRIASCAATWPLPACQAWSTHPKRD